jgi:hypothetical protein
MIYSRFAATTRHLVSEVSFGILSPCPLKILNAIISINYFIHCWKIIISYSGKITKIEVSTYVQGAEKYIWTLENVPEDWMKLNAEEIYNFSLLTIKC